MTSVPTAVFRPPLAPAGGGVGAVQTTVTCCVQRSLPSPTPYTAPSLLYFRRVLRAEEAPSLLARVRRAAVEVGRDHLPEAPLAPWLSHDILVPA